MIGLISSLFALNINNSFTLAKQFGATEFVNPKDHDKPIQQVCYNLLSALSLTVSLYADDS